MEDFVFNKDRAERTVLAYSLPGTKEFLLAKVASLIIAQTESKLEDYDFVFSPFTTGKVPKILIKISSLTAGRKFSCFADISCTCQSTTKQNYSLNFQQIQQAIAREKVDKVVLSRIKLIEQNTSELYNYYIQLKNTYPSAFTYLLHIPDYGTWLGASPELLLESDDAVYRTRAIAGTRSSNIDSTLFWSKKDTDEHAFVLTYLREQLNELRAEYTISNNYNLDTGVVSHICSDIDINKSKAANMASILSLLHPSPALSGYPKELAIQMINKIESHSRAYYCGYLGPISENNCKLFANIRCMKAFTDAFALYLGGGIVAASDLEKEWQETEIKSETLEKVITAVVKEVIV